MTSVHVAIDASERQLEIRWPDGRASRFHYVWLRHSGRCSHGMPNDTSVKIDLVPDDPTVLRVDTCAVTGDLLQVSWADEGLVTEHSLETLRRWGYDRQSRSERKHSPLLWNAESAASIPIFDHPSLTEPENRFQLLCTVRDFGVARIRDVPIAPGTVAEVAEYFGPVHVNNYGRVFDVRTDNHAGLGSNTGAALGPHTDESYRHAPPGISLFHCLAASTCGGGESILVDGFAAAQVLREKDPESFRVLSRVPLFFQRLSPNHEDMRAYGRVIATDIDGDVVGIRFTDRTLPPQDLPDEEVEDVYRAIRGFWQIVSDSAMQWIYALQPGELHVFDNHRVLHGRHAFNADGNPRHLQQCSVNRDEFHNALRLMAAERNSPDQHLIMSGGALG